GAGNNRSAQSALDLLQQAATRQGRRQKRLSCVKQSKAEMASAVDDDGPYTYDGVEKRFIKRAEKELNEKPAQVTAHIASLRRWLGSMPHLRCRTDDRFLLRFLRVAKFDQSRAQMLLDNYLTIRKSPKGTPSWFDYPSVDSPEVKEYLSHPFHVFLGHTSEGEGVYVSNMGYWDQQKMTFEQLIRCMYMSMDQYSQINGIKILVDMNQANRNQMSFFENRKNFFSLMRNWQDAFPVRIRTVIYVNEPAFFDVIFTLIKNAPFLKEKFKKKLHKVGKDYARLRKVIGEQDADRLLPKELGGSNGTLQELMEWTRNNFGSERGCTGSGAFSGRRWRLTNPSGCQRPRTTCAPRTARRTRPLVSRAPSPSSTLTELDTRDGTGHRNLIKYSLKSSRKPRVKAKVRSRHCIVHYKYGSQADTGPAEINQRWRPPLKTSGPTTTKAWSRSLSGGPRRSSTRSPASCRPHRQPETLAEQHAAPQVPD
uniref:CRAL-TRIO domain-containing protein n=1 Tax=Macrostomum lignano TaxID=282301 RepID=A0A1I8JNV5_9PLAT